MRRIFNGLYTPMFEADGGGNGGNGEGEKGGDEGGNGGADDDKSKVTVTMTQADLDALIQREKARAKKPYGDYDDLKAKVSTLEAAETERAKAAMTETERLQAEKDAAVKKAGEAEALRTEALSKADKRVIKSEFKALAREMGVRADALEDAHVLADLTSVSVDDDGNVIGAKEAVEALLGAKPYLAETTKPTPKPIGGASGHDDKAPQKTKDQLLAEAAEKARKSGRREDRAAYAALKDELSK